MKKQNAFVTPLSKRCVITEDCNRYLFLIIVRFNSRNQCVFQKSATSFPIKSPKIKFLAKKRAIMIDDTLKIIFDFRQSAHDRQLLLAHQQHRHKPHQSIPQLA